LTLNVASGEGLTLEEAITEARKSDERRKAIGYDQAALDASARQCFANGSFEESEEEIPEVVEEFYGEGLSRTDAGDHEATGESPIRPTLRDKLDMKALTQSGTTV
jgi:hypothetical protein